MQRLAVHWLHLRVSLAPSCWVRLAEAPYPGAFAIAFQDAAGEAYLDAPDEASPDDLVETCLAVPDVACLGVLVGAYLDDPAEAYLGALVETFPDDPDEA